MNKGNSSQQSENRKHKLVNDSDNLSSLPNIGKILAEKLTQIGIHSEKELKSAGAENIFIQIATVHQDACINMLYAIEGAIQGIRWHDLNESRKSELREFFQMVKK